MDKDMKKLFAALEEQGFTVEQTKNGHFTVKKDGQRVTTFAGTASDSRSMKNGIGYCKRAGFKWPP